MEEQPDSLEILKGSNGIDGSVQVGHVVEDESGKIHWM